MFDVPLAVGDDLDAVLEPLDLGVVLLHGDLELALVVLHAVHRLQLRSELVLHVCWDGIEQCSGNRFLRHDLLSISISVNSGVLQCTESQGTRTADADIAGGLVLALLAELDDLAGVLARVLLLRALDLQLLHAVVRRDEEVRVRRLDLLPVLEPLDLDKK